MAGTERPYQDLDKESLVRILDHLPQDDIRLATIYVNVLESRAKDPARLWEEEYKKIFQVAEKYIEFPPHKIEWFLEAVDLIGRTLTETPGKAMPWREMEKVFRISGFFDKRYVDPEIKKIYEKKSNWRYENGYQGQEWGTFIGDRDIQRLVEEDSKFSYEDMESLLGTMLRHGHIKPLNDRFNSVAITEGK
jgi:hypothetical protein